MNRIFSCAILNSANSNSSVVVNSRRSLASLKDFFNRGDKETKKSSETDLSEEFKTQGTAKTELIQKDFELFRKETTVRLTRCKAYKPPNDVEEQIKQICKEEFKSEFDEGTYKELKFANTKSKFNVLTKCIEKFQHNISNPVLNDLHTIRDVIVYFQSEQKDTSALEDLHNRPDLPKNLHINLEYNRFDPATEKFFNGRDAYAQRDTIVNSLWYSRKYKSVIKKKEMSNPRHFNRNANSSNFSRNKDQSHHGNKRSYASTQQSETNATTSNEIQIPGFYFDPIKNKYFKIQANSFGSQSFITNESLKTKKQEELAAAQTRKSKRTTRNLMHTLNETEFGANEQLRIDLSDYSLNKASLKKLVEFNSIDIGNVRSIKVLGKANRQQSDESMYVFVNFADLPYSFRIFKFSNLSAESNSHTGKFKFTLVNLANFNQQNEYLNDELSTLSFLPAHIHETDQSTLLISYSHTEAQQKPYICKINQLENCAPMNSFKIIEKCRKSFSKPMWCNALETASSSQILATGLPNCLNVSHLQTSHTCNLDTHSSDVFAIKFKPNSFGNLLFAGCKNKKLFGYDLRDRSMKSFVRFEHDSCVNDLLFDVLDENRLFSSDYTGQVFVWDLRMNNVLNRYFNNVESNSQCTIKQSDCGTYLLSSGKDGNVRIWNTRTSQLCRVLNSPLPKQRDEWYAEIPSFDFVSHRNSSFIPPFAVVYGIQRRIMHFSC